MKFLILLLIIGFLLSGCLEEQVKTPIIQLWEFDYNCLAYQEAVVIETPVIIYSFDTAYCKLDERIQQLEALQVKEGSGEE